MTAATAKKAAKKTTKKATKRATAKKAPPPTSNGVEDEGPGWTQHPGLVALHRAAFAPFDDTEIGKKPIGNCRNCEDAGPKPWDTCNKHEYLQPCPECGQNHTSALKHHDFVGHADAWHRVLNIDPMATWVPMAYNEFGGPHIEKTKMGKSEEWSMWIVVKIHTYAPDGSVAHVIERPGVGTIIVTRHTKEPLKQLISDALRSAVMRQGVALELWAKGDREWSEETANAVAVAEGAEGRPAPEPEKPEPASRKINMDAIKTHLGDLPKTQITTVMKAARNSDAWAEGDTDGVIEFIKSFVRAQSDNTPQTVEEAAEKLQSEFPGSTEVETGASEGELEPAPEQEPEPAPEGEGEESADDPDRELKDEIRALYVQVPKKGRPLVMASLKKDGLWPLSSLDTPQLRKVLQRLSEEPF